MISRSSSSAFSPRGPRNHALSASFESRDKPVSLVVGSKQLNLGQAERTSPPQVT